MQLLVSLFERRLKDGDKFDGTISRGRAAVLGTLGHEDEFASFEADFTFLEFVSPLSGNTENHLVHLVMMSVVGFSRGYLRPVDGNIGFVCPPCDYSFMGGPAIDFIVWNFQGSD